MTDLTPESIFSELHLDALFHLGVNIIYMNLCMRSQHNLYLRYLLELSLFYYIPAPKEKKTTFCSCPYKTDRWGYGYKYVIKSCTDGLPALVQRYCWHLYGTRMHVRSWAWHCGLKNSSWSLLRHRVGAAKK